MVPFLRLIRIANLLIIGLTQYFIRYFFIEPIGNLGGYNLIMSHIDFALLVFSSLLVAGAGYIINDYYDVRIDSINKPEKVIIGKRIKRRHAMLIHLLLNSVAIIIAMYLGHKVGFWQLGFVHFISAFLLWAYSSNYKRQFLSGNLIICFLTGLSVIIPAIYEFVFFSVIKARTPELFIQLAYGVGVYAGFSVLTTFLREVVKDAEDMEGDLDSNCNTIPIVLGIPKTKILLVAIALITLSALAYLSFLQLNGGDTIAFLYVTLLLNLPLLLLIYRIITAKEKKDYSFISLLIKLIMLFGVLSIPTFYLMYRYL